MGVERAPDRGGRARRLQGRAQRHSSALEVRERAAHAASRKRDARNTDSHGRTCRQERHRGAERTGSADPSRMTVLTRRPAKAPVALVMRRLAKAIDGLDEPAVEKIAKDQQEDPFQVLIATMLSAQTRDAVTAAASARLFRVARTPRSMAKLSTARIQELIYP